MENSPLKYNHIHIYINNIERLYMLLSSVSLEKNVSIVEKIALQALRMHGHQNPKLVKILM